MKKRAQCMCSLCKTFLRATSERGDQDYAALVELKSICFEDRKYQAALIEYAKNQNIMGCLPTGSGKTFIALKLMEHYKEQVMSEGKKIFFLANTIPLVNQQSAFIARNSNFKVRFLTGDCGVDYFTKDTWDAIIEEFHVIAMTSQIFLNMINHGHIKFSQTVLLVFDECHHASGESKNSHPMTNIMKAYKAVKSQEPNHPLPRILGLTATIIKGNCKPMDVPSKVRDVENVMDSVALTYKDYEEVLRHSTSAEVKPMMFTNCSMKFNTCDEIINEMEDVSKQLQSFRNERKKAKLGMSKMQPNAIDPNLKTFDNVYNLMLIKPSPGDLRVALDDIIHVYNELGLYCTVIAINLRLAFIEFSLMDINDNSVETWYHKIKGYFKKLVTEILAVMDRVDKKRQLTEFNSEKLTKLIGILNRYREFESDTICQFGSDDKRLCGLVFTNRRTTAQVLAWYFKDLAAGSEDHKFIKADFVVGTSRSSFESIESRVYARKQTETLNRFRRKESNLLIATSVLEEGIDVPSCNIVVRFDPVDTYTSYIQSMGRARKKGAEFYALLPSENYLKNVEKLKTFQEINKRITSYLQTNVEKIDSGEYQTNFTYAADLIPPICPGGTAESPRITMNSAIDVIERYCCLLPSDGISCLQTMSWWKEINPTLFQATLKLPLNSVLQESIVGIPMSSKDLAKQAVCMAAAQKLLDADVLDEQLIPAHPKFSLTMEKKFAELVPTLNEENEVEDGEVTETGTISGEPTAAKKSKTVQPQFSVIKRTWCTKREPKVFTDYPLKQIKKFYAYRIVFNLVKERDLQPWKNLYQIKDFKHAIGIICGHKLPNIGKIPLFGSFGTMECSLERISIEKETIDLIQLEDIQRKCFFDILGLTNPLLKDNRDYGYIIVPLYHKDRKQWKLDYKIMDELRGLNDIQKTKRPIRNRDQSRSRAPKNPRDLVGCIIFPWYKRPKPVITAYLVDSVAHDVTPLTKIDDGDHPNYKNFWETQYKVRIEHVNQPLLKCKFAGIALNRAEKDPLQLNYLLEKYTKEDAFPVYLSADLCHSVALPAKFIVQLKFIPSFLHRLTRVLLGHELLQESFLKVNYPTLEGNSPSDGFDGFSSLEITQNFKKCQEEIRRKERLRLREERIRNKPKKPNEQIPHIEERELHYEFIHPNDITFKHIKIFHEAVSTQHSAKKLTNNTAEVEIVAAKDLVGDSKFELSPMNEIKESLDPVEKDIAQFNYPSLLSVMEALSSKYSNDGSSNERLQSIGMSFMSFAVSLFAYQNFPQWGEPLMCQLRNRMLSNQIVYAIGRKMNIDEILSGSDYYPGASWTPPGQKVPTILGEVAVANKFHLCIFEELAGNRSNPIQHRTREELEKYAIEKSKLDAKESIECENSDSLFATRYKVWRKDSEDATATSSNLNETRPSRSTTVGDQNQPSRSSQSQAMKSKKDRKRATPIAKHSTFTHTELTEFDVINSLFAIVGTFFCHGGPAAGYKALEWLDFKVPDNDGVEKCVHNVGNFTHDDAVAPQFLLNQLKSVEDQIEYQFTNKTLLLQVFTHPTYPAHNLKKCYQRLEFLGDSILDLLLTNYIYSLSNNDGYQPDDLRNMRCALINSVTYASLAVRYNLNKQLLSMSKSLTDMIDNFVVYQQSVEHHVVGHFTLISDEECYGPKHIEVPKVLADIWEALAGAIFIDSGGSLDVVWRVFYRLMQQEIDYFTEKKSKAPIVDLKAFTDSKEVALLFNRCTGKKMLARGRELYKVSVGPFGSYYGSGTNRSRAKDAAAKLAWKLIKEEEIFSKLKGESSIMLMP